MKNWPKGAVDGLYPHGGDRTDLRGIIRYTGKEWGAAQVRRYIARLEQGIVNLAAGRGPFRDMSDLFSKAADDALRMSLYRLPGTRKCTGIILPVYFFWPRM